MRAASRDAQSNPPRRPGSAYLYRALQIPLAKGEQGAGIRHGEAYGRWREQMRPLNALKRQFAIGNGSKRVESAGGKPLRDIPPKPGPQP